MTPDASWFDIRIATSESDLLAAQRLRYRVFVQELGGDGPMVDHDRRLERDEFDPIVDHLVLVDVRRDPAQLDHVVGVYRLLPGQRAAQFGRFYCDAEYDLTRLKASGRTLLELGRSCVHPDYRGGAGMFLLWNALADYVLDLDVEILFGVASFHGIDPVLLAPALSWLHHHHLAPEAIRPVALPGGYQRMDLIPAEALVRREALLSMPPLIKAYLRLGGVVGEGAYLDRPFNTTDVLVLMDTGPCPTSTGAITKDAGKRHDRCRRARGRHMARGCAAGAAATGAAGLAAGGRPGCGGGGRADAGRRADRPDARGRAADRRSTPAGDRAVGAGRLPDGADWFWAFGGAAWAAPMRGPGAAVANHSSWLDIFVLNAAMPVFFVSKAEVARWPGINILTRVTRTHFVARDPRLARQQATELAARTGAGHRLLFFPEGTSSDGRRVLPFKPTLFQGFLDPALPDGLAVQPISATYHAPPGRDAGFYGWFGDMALGPHLLAVLAQPRQGRVTVTLHPPVAVAGHSRKSLCAACETAVRSAMPEAASPDDAGTVARQSG